MLNIDNDGRHINEIVSRVPCKRHAVEIGEACFISFSGAEEILLGVCNWRSKKAGFNGKISEAALSGKGR